MEPIQLLEREHRAIERVLETLDQYAASQSRASTRASQKDLLQFVEFIRQFADRIHHGKEEKILFEQMVEAGFPRGSGPLAVMIHEHDQARALARTLHALGEKERPWSEVDRRRVKEICAAYTSLVRQHIRKEDEILYPMALSRLGPEALGSIAGAFAEFERKDSRTGEKERLLAMAHQLVQRYGTPTESDSNSPPGRGG